MIKRLQALSVRTRFVGLMMLIGLVPMLIAFVIGNRMVARMSTLGSDIQTDYIQINGKKELKTRADNIAHQIALYLAEHPDTSVRNAEALQENKDLVNIASQTFGQTGYSFVFNTQGNILLDPNPERVGVDLETYQGSLGRYWSLIKKAMDGSSADGEYDLPNEQGIMQPYYLMVVPVENSALRVGVTMSTAELIQENEELRDQFARTAQGTNLLFITISVIAAVVIAAGAIFVGWELSAEIIIMSENAGQVMRNLPDPVTMPKNVNELEFLHQAFVEMTRLVRDLRTNLDKQVKIRTADLARRSMQVETAAQVAREAASIMDVHKLLDQTPVLISDRFGFYHAGIFLVDAAGEYAILQASNSEGGKKLLAKGHRLRVGQTGVVGRVAKTGELLVVHDVTLDDVHVRNPELMRTRAELALPLKVHGKVIGVLDVQSTEPYAFSPDDIKILTLLADQVALAIENARLLQESQKALRELNALYGHQAREAWQQRVGSQPLAFSYTALDVQETAPELVRADEAYISRPVMKTEEGSHKLAVPIFLRGQALGSIVLKRDADQPDWDPEDLALMQDLSGQFANALENARLMETIQRHAHQERMIGEIAAKAQSSLDLETVIRTSVQEIGTALKANRVQIRIGKEEEPADGGNGHPKDGNGHKSPAPANPEVRS